MNLKVTVLGSFVAGLTVHATKPPLMGESFFSSIFDFGPGGKGLNQAIGLKRLGADVNIIMKIGNDVFGEIVYSLLNKEGISTNYVLQTDQVNSGVGLVYLYPNGENTIGIYPGANELMSPADIQKIEDELICSKLVLSQLEIKEAPIRKAFKIAKKHGVITMLNPAPARNLSLELLALCDIITPNIIELQMILGKRHIQESLTNGEVVELAKELHSKGPKEVIVTLGSHGSVAVSNRDCFFEPSISVEKVVDTVGAGDCYTAGFAMAKLENKSLQECLQRATVSGGLATKKLGVINAIPYRNDIEQYIGGIS